jgi:hypothetical protein
MLNKDSLYAIGGKLTIDARGALTHIDNIDNRFKVNSDSIFPPKDTIPKHNIVINEDPANNEFSAFMATDRIKAVAWQEHAGWGDNICHGQYRPCWNQYWDDFIVNNDTCRGSHKPCENTISTATGVMQILRLKDCWEPLFAGLKPGYPAGFDTCLWDSLAWNWKVCIDNGKYIHDIYMQAKFAPEQEEFPDSCSLADCDTFPKSKNQEDLKTFGYHKGEDFMKLIIDDDTWKLYIADKDRRDEWSRYVQDVRKYFYRKPW